MKKLRIGIVGAGVSGLVAAKELLNAGHEVQIFEKNAEIGGVFYYKPHEDGGVYDSCHLTISNYFMAFSDFFPKDRSRRYWHHSEYFQYISDYMDAFNLRPHINLKATVTEVKEIENNQVLMTISSDGKMTSHVFDHVVVCNGSHQTPKMPQLTGEAEFVGKIMHSAEFKNNKIFAGKNVLLIGLGESASDVVYEIACVAASCIISIRRKQSIVPRFFKDPCTTSIYHTNDSYTCRFSHQILSQKQFEGIAYKLYTRMSKSDDPFTKSVGAWNASIQNRQSMFLNKNDNFFRAIVNGKAIVNESGIFSLKGKTVKFNDGTIASDIDFIVCNTGYQDRFDFIKDKEITDVRDLYKHMIDPDFRERIVFIGFARPAEGGIPFSSEMQARYFCKLLEGKAKLPPKNVLSKIIEKEKKEEEAHYYLSPYPRTIVNYSKYVDWLAKEIGCYPIKFSTLFKPTLLRKLIFGSQMPCQYRIHENTPAGKQALKTVLMMSDPLFELSSKELPKKNLLFRLLIMLLKVATPKYKVQTEEVAENGYEQLDKSIEKFSETGNDK